LAQAYGGGSGYKQVDSTFALVTGDIDENVFAFYYNKLVNEFEAINGYLNFDLNLVGSGFVSDYKIWAVNFVFAN